MMHITYKRQYYLNVLIQSQIMHFNHKLVNFNIQKMNVIYQHTFFLVTATLKQHKINSRPDRHLIFSLLYQKWSVDWFYRENVFTKSVQICPYFHLWVHCAKCQVISSKIVHFIGKKHKINPKIMNISIQEFSKQHSLKML